MKRKMSIKDISEIADVSVATISRVMNHKGGYSATVESKVWEVIEKYNYKPNLLAKGLRTNRTSLIGIIIPDIANEYYSKMVLELQAELFREGYLITFCNVNEDVELENQQIEALIAQNVSGLILISETVREYHLDQVNIPVVYVDRRPILENQDSLIYVESDNKQGGYLATRELIESACRNILFVVNSKMESSKTARYQGYEQALKEAGFSVKNEYMIKIPRATQEEAEKAITDVIRQGIEFDGVMCTTDMIAIGTVIALKKAGKRVPEDVKVTGYDDISISRLFRPSITTIHQDIHKMAQIAVELLVNLIEEKALDKQRFCIPVTLQRRDSTKI